MTKSKEIKESHLAKSGVTSPTVDLGNGAVAQLYTNTTGNVNLNPSNNIQNERDGEHRDADTIPKADQASSDIFNSGNASVSMRTPAERGQSIRKRSGPETWESTR